MKHNIDKALPRSGPSAHLIFGIILLFLGSLFLLNNLGILRAWAILRYWPVALILVGAFKIIQARTGAGYVAGGTWALFGTLLLLDNLNYFEFWDLWPLFLIWLGVFMLFKSKNPVNRDALIDMNSTVSATAILGGLERRNNSPDFRGGELTAVMGGCEIDLSSASIKSGEAVIDAFAMWGGVEVKVPPDWTVVSKVYPIMGGFEDQTQPPKDDSKRLIIRGFAIMGGIGVKN